MRDLARALPEDVWLTSLVGTVSPGVTFEGGGSAGATGSLRSALPAPAIEMIGCTVSQSDVSRVLARLRTMHGVQRVSLASSEKSDSTTGPVVAGNGGGSGDCRNGDGRFPLFQVVVFFDAPKAAQTAQGTTPSQAATQTTSNGTGK
jgi:hypothetical protein